LLPYLTQARAPFVREVSVVDEFGDTGVVSIPAERALTVYVDKRELITLGVPIIVSRSGMTQMGHEVAQQLGLCAIGRATNKRFLCYAGAHRLQLQPELAGLRSLHRQEN